MNTLIIYLHGGDKIETDGMTDPVVMEDGSFLKFGERGTNGHISPLYGGIHLSTVSHYIINRNTEI